MIPANRVRRALFIEHSRSGSSSFSIKMKNLKALLITIAIIYLASTTFALIVRQVDAGDAFSEDSMAFLIAALIVGVAFIIIIFGWLFFVQAPALHWFGLGFATFLVCINIYRQNPDFMQVNWGIYPAWDILVFQVIPAWIVAFVALIRNPNCLTRKETHLQQVFNDAVEETATTTKWAD